MWCGMGQGKWRRGRGQGKCGVGGGRVRGVWDGAG